MLHTDNDGECWWSSRIIFSKQPIFKLMYVTLHLIIMFSLCTKNTILHSCIHNTYKAFPLSEFMSVLHTVSIDQADYIHNDPYQVLTDDANINTYMNNQSAYSLNFDMHILRSNSNHSSNGKNIQMNDSPKMFSNNPRTIANGRAKEKQKEVKTSRQ